MRVLLLTTSLFLLSLIDYNNYLLLIALSLMILNCFISNTKINKSTLVILAVSILFIGFEFIRYQYNVDSSYWLGDISQGAIIGLYSTIIIGLVFSLLFYSYYLGSGSQCDDCIKSVEYLIFIHILFFFVQFSLVYTSGFYLDFFEYINSEPSRYINYFTSSPLTFRSTGLYVEPSTYASVMAILIVFYLNMAKGKPSLKLLFFSLVSIFLTFSNAAIAIGVILAFGSFVSFKQGRFFIRILLIITSLLFLTLVVLASLRSELPSIDYISSIRLGLVNYLLDRSGSLFWFGSGLFGIEDELWNLSSGNGGDRVSSLNDLGVIIVLFTRMGLFGIFIYGTLYYLLPNKKINTINFLLVSITKLTIYFPIFVVVFSSFYFTVYLRNNSHEN